MPKHLSWLKGLTARSSSGSSHDSAPQAADWPRGEGQWGLEFSPPVVKDFVERRQCLGSDDIWEGLSLYSQQLLDCSREALFIARERTALATGTAPRRVIHSRMNLGQSRQLAPKISEHGKTPY